MEELECCEDHSPDGPVLRARIAKHHRKATQRKLQLADEHPTHLKQRLLSTRTTTHPLLHAVTNPVRSFDTFLPRQEGLVPIITALKGNESKGETLH